MDWSQMTAIEAAPEFRSDSGGMTAMQRFRVTGVDAAGIRSVQPKRGDQADAMAAGWVVDNSVAVPIAPLVWQLTVTAVPFLRFNSHSRAPSPLSVLLKKFSVDYDKRDFEFTPEILGLQRRDVNSPYWKPYAEDLGNATPPGLDAWMPVYVDKEKLYNSIVQPGFSWARVVPRECPFDLSPWYNLIGQRLPADVATIVFNVAGQDATPWVDFQGVNAAGSIPDSYRLPDRQTPGVWRVIDQRLKDGVTDDNQKYLEITRTLMRVPAAYNDEQGQNPLRWDADKLGGVMKWRAAK